MKQLKLGKRSKKLAYFHNDTFDIAAKDLSSTRYMFRVNAEILVLETKYYGTNTPYFENYLDCGKRLRSSKAKHLAKLIRYKQFAFKTKPFSCDLEFDFEKELVAKAREYGVISSGDELRRDYLNEWTTKLV